MAVGTIVRLPEGVTAEQYDAVTAQLDLENNPIDGNLVHCAGDLEGRFQIFDVWESLEHNDRFVQERLIPAQKAAFGEEAFAQLPPADRTTAEIHHLIIPGT